jgi:Zn-dependent M28 family amino/carboxypeptidase
MKNLLYVALLFLFSCQSASVTFDGDKAMTYLVQQCDIGTREPGSEGHETAKNFYIDFLNQYADKVLLQEFDQHVARDSVTFQLTNIIAGFNVEKGNALLVGAHWDTRPRAEFDPNPANRDKPILGANDGASGIAVLMHLAELLHTQELNRTVYLVFFDGEDYGYHDTTEYFCMGSKYFAANLPVKNISEAIIVDMIGDKNLEIPIERNSYASHKTLIKKLWKIAEKYDFKAYKNHLGLEIYDDHIPLIEIAGIPSVDLIDFTYPDKYTNYWHTQADTPDKCSGESLRQVGQVVLDYILETQK